MFARKAMRLALFAGGLLALSACQELDYGRHLVPLPPAMEARLERMGLREEDPIYIRIFKEEGELEVWKQNRDGRFVLLETYEICAWSGELGPKIREGDRQAPEGFYTISPAQMNPQSNYYLSFNLGFPNAYDRANGRTGSHLMVHGACSSAGCYAMTDDQIAVIYALAREAFSGGQRAFQVHAFPFRMTPENMARHRGSPNFAFWRMLKEGYDHFEATGRPPQVDVCERRYVFDAVTEARFSPTGACPSFEVPQTIRERVAARRVADDAAFQVAVARLEEEEAGRRAAEAEATPDATPDQAPQPAAPGDVLIAGDAPVEEPEGASAGTVSTYSGPAVPPPAIPPNAVPSAEAEEPGVMGRILGVFR